jgi:hypothetical protein
MDERVMDGICMISKEPGGDLVVRNSRLIPSQKLIVRKSLYDQGYEPRSLVVIYGQSLLQQSGARWIEAAKDKAFMKIVDQHLYCGDTISVRELLKR